MNLINPWSSSYKSKQGNIGLGKAISIFTEVGINVAIPLNDTQDYDLIIDIGKLKKISVKTTKFRQKNGKFAVLLKRCGGSAKNRKIKHFNNKNNDFLFCFTSNNEIYLIPSCKIKSKCTLTFTDKLKCYRIYDSGHLDLSALEEILDVETP